MLTSWPLRLPGSRRIRRNMPKGVSEPSPYEVGVQAKYLHAHRLLRHKSLACGLNRCLTLYRSWGKLERSPLDIARIPLVPKQVLGKNPAEKLALAEWDYIQKLGHCMGVPQAWSS